MGAHTPNQEKHSNVEMLDKQIEQKFLLFPELCELMNLVVSPLISFFYCNSAMIYWKFLWIMATLGGTGLTENSNRMPFLLTVTLLFLDNTIQLNWTGR